MRHEARKNGSKESNNSDQIVAKAPPDEQCRQSGHNGEGEVRILSQICMSQRPYER
jgi:hypothetical protein